MYGPMANPRLRLLAAFSLAMAALIAAPRSSDGGDLKVINVSNNRLLVNIHFVGSDPNGLASVGWLIVEPTTARDFQFPGEIAWVRVQKAGNNNPLEFPQHQVKENILMSGEFHEIRVNPVDNRFRLLKWGPSLQNQANWKQGEMLPPGWAFIEHFRVTNGARLEVTPG